MTVMTLRNTWVILLLFSLVYFSGCSKKAPVDPEVKPNPDPAPDPDPEEDETFYRLSSGEIEEFSLYIKGEFSAEVPSAEGQKHFQNRPKYFQPQTLKLKTDSLFLTKLGGITEAYKIKWEEQKLLIYVDESKEWKYFADKQGDQKKLVLHIVYYKNQLRNTHNISTQMGQLYNPSSIQEVLSDKNKPNSEMLWLKTKSTFTPEKETP